MADPSELYSLCRIVPGTRIDTFPTVGLLVSQGSSSYSIAPVENFDIEASLYYSNTQISSQCLQGSNNINPCLGICTTNAQLCNQTCPRFLGYTGRKYVDYKGDQYFLQDSIGGKSAGRTGMIMAADSCSYKVKCSGRKGVSSCESLQINRAGTYSLKFSFPPCVQNTFKPWESIPQPCKSPFIVSSLFEVVANPTIVAGSMACITTLEQNQIHRNFARQPIVEVVDAFGNLVNGAVVQVSLSAENRGLSGTNSVLWPQHENIFLGASNLTQDVTAVEANVGGNRTAVSKNGYAAFTDLKIEVAMKRAILMFTSGMGLWTLSRPFEVVPGRIANLKIRQQPYVWEAGQFVMFEIGLLDSDMFVVQSENVSVFMETLVDEMGHAALVRCPNSSNSCWKSIAQNGFARFNFSISNAGEFYRIRFFLNSNSSDSSKFTQPWVGAVLTYSNITNLNVSVTSAPFTILHTYPSKIIVSSPPSQVRSQEQFALTAALSDEYGNSLFRSLEFEFELQDLEFRIGCDSILLQTICDIDLCSNSPLTRTIIGDCCMIPKSLPLNNQFRCSLEMNANESLLAHSYQVKLDFRNSSEKRVIAINSSYTLKYSIQQESTSPVLDGILMKHSVGIASFENLTIGQVGMYSLLFSVANMTSKTSKFSVCKFFFVLYFALPAAESSSSLRRSWRSCENPHHVID
jgi:hypothetical protein